MHPGIRLLFGFLLFIGLAEYLEHFWALALVERAQVAIHLIVNVDGFSIHSDLTLLTLAWLNTA